MPSATPTRSASSSGSSTERLQVSGKSLLIGTASITAAILLLDNLPQAKRIIFWILGAFAIAGLVYPIVEKMSRRIPQVLAVLITMVSIGAMVAVTTYLTVDDVRREGKQLQKVAPAEVREFESGDGTLNEL